MKMFDVHYPDCFSPNPCNFSSKVGHLSLMYKIIPEKDAGKTEVIKEQRRNRRRFDADKLQNVQLLTKKIGSLN